MLAQRESRDASDLASHFRRLKNRQCDSATEGGGGRWMEAVSARARMLQTILGGKAIDAHKEKFELPKYLALGPVLCDPRGRNMGQENEGAGTT